MIGVTHIQNMLKCMCVKVAEGEWDGGRSLTFCDLSGAGQISGGIGRGHEIFGD